MGSIICGVVIWLLIAAGILSIADDGFGIEISFIMIGIICVLIAWSIDSNSSTVSYIEDIKELQKIEGEYFRDQENNYIVKWDNEIMIIPKTKVYTVHSDSAYFAIQYKKIIKNYTKSRQRWIPGKQVNDTLYQVNKYHLYRNLNE